MLKRNQTKPSAVDLVLKPDLPPEPAVRRFDTTSPVVAVARGHVAIQFALTGMRVEEVNTAGEAEDAIKELIEEQVDMVVVDSRFRDDFTAVFDEKLAEHRGKPLVVFCPSFDDEPAAVEAALAAEIKSAIGYEIRLE